MQATPMREKIDCINHDIRRRGAEEPELRPRCEDLDEELESLQEQITNMYEEIKGKSEQIMHLEVEQESWKHEAAKLSDDLNEANAKLEYLGKRGLSGAEPNANGHDPPWDTLLSRSGDHHIGQTTSSDKKCILK